MMSRLLGFALTLGVVLFAAQPAHTQTIDAYIELFAALAENFGVDSVVEDCQCTTDAINRGDCNALCQESGCQGILGGLASCSANHTCTECSQLLQPGLIAAACTFEDLQLIFGAAGDDPICEAVNPTIDYVVDAVQLNEDVREACQSVADIVEDEEACTNLCEARTCSAYLGELQVCAKGARDINCYRALEALRFHVAGGYLDCQSFDSVNGACNVAPDGEGLYNVTFASFNDLFPVDFGFVLSESTTTACQCLTQAAQTCNICDATTDCEVYAKLADCAAESAACDATDCAVTLNAIGQLYTNTTCFLVEEDEYECASNTTVAGCSPVDFNRDSCLSRIGGLNETDVPVFSPPPTFSNSPTPSTTRSISRSPGSTPSNTPSVSVSSSEGSTSPASSLSLSPLALVAFLFATYLMH